MAFYDYHKIVFCYNDNMTIKLIATDMDGTFLDIDGAYDKQRFDTCGSIWSPALGFGKFVC